jgi:hypothetical protein
MIYDGFRGYTKGSLNQAVNTVLALTKGPLAGKNWMNSGVNPAYSITITAGATGAVKLQGTNDVAYGSSDDSLNPVSMDFGPKFNASWSDIQTATSSSVTGTFATSYAFLRLIISTQGTGTVRQAWVSWN